MGKGGRTTQETRQQQMLDPASRRFVEQFLRPLGQQGANLALGHEGSFFAGPHAAQMGGLGALQGQDLSQVGQFGFSPQMMDPNRAQAFFNPFQQEVIGGMQGDFDRQRGLADTAAAQQATAAGAFGGSREAVMRAQAMGDVNRNEASTLANLRHGGFQQAMGMAGQEHQLMQGLGFQSALAGMQGGLQRAGLEQQRAGQMFGMGSQLQQLQQQRAMEPMWRQQQALQFANLGLGPTGMIGTGFHEERTPGNLFKDLLGVGLMGAGLGWNPFGGGGG